MKYACTVNPLDGEHALLTGTKVEERAAKDENENKVGNKGFMEEG